jgi:hypothetical protein
MTWGFAALFLVIVGASLMHAAGGAAHRQR